MYKSKGTHDTLWKRYKRHRSQAAFEMGARNEYIRREEQVKYKRNIVDKS